MKKGDFFTIVILFLVVLLSFFLTHTPKDTKNLKCIIRVNGEIYKEIKLQENYNNCIEINSSFGYNKICVEGNTVKMTESDCADRLCVKEKAISEPFESIICLPSRVIVYIEGETELNYVSY